MRNSRSPAGQLLNNRGYRNKPSKQRTPNTRALAETRKATRWRQHSFDTLGDTRKAC